MSWTKTLVGLCASIALCAVANVALAAPPPADAPFIIANMAPPEPETPPPTPDAPPEAVPAAPAEATPPDVAPPEPATEPAAPTDLPPADSTPPSKGTSLSTWIAIAAVLAISIFGAAMAYRRK